MKTVCYTCMRDFDDARRSTICPHDPIMSDEKMDQKDAGLSLIGKDVHFAHDVGGAVHHVTSCGFDGMVALNTLPGWFAPHLFTPVSPQ